MKFHRENFIRIPFVKTSNCGLFSRFQRIHSFDRFFEPTKKKEGKKSRNVRKTEKRPHRKIFRFRKNDFMGWGGARPTQLKKNNFFWRGPPD